MNNLKEEFIKYFGEEKWEEEEILAIYQDAVMLVCSEYLGIEPISVVFEKLECDVARYDIKEKAIILNTKYKDSYIELMNATLHELEHHWQMIYITNSDTPKAKRWKDLLNNHKTGEIDELEVDAYAFAKVIGNIEFGFDYQTGVIELDYIIDKYISTKKLTSND